ncbi:hypothetical protein GQ457_HM002010 [Hibiscus cannabinus]
MLPTKSIRKTDNLFHEAVESLKSLFFTGYQKLSKQPISNPFSCTSCSREKHRKDRSYTDREVGLEEATVRKNNAMTLKEMLREEDECSGSFMSFEEKSPVKITKQNGGKEEKTEEGCYPLVKKMKELEMMDVGDIEHVLDVEEAIHYYSRLRSPVYLSIVDKFFTDMYSEFSVPQASTSIDSSKRRLGSFRM